MSETDTDTRETSIVMVELQDAWFNARNCAIKAYAEAARAALAAIETDRLNVSDGRRAARVLAKAGNAIEHVTDSPFHISRVGREDTNE